MSVSTTTDLAYQQCINPACRTTLAVDQVAFACPECGDLLDVVYDWNRLPVPRCLADFEARWAERRDPLNFSGVWRFRDLLPFAPPEAVVTIGSDLDLPAFLTQAELKPVTIEKVNIPPIWSLVTCIKD